jgi:single-strand DNA-binding protein
MADLNKVFLMGRLTFDPELRRTPSGTAVAELRLATKRTWQGRDGDRKEETLFIDVTVWDRQAETCCQYLKKGSGIHVEGYLKMDAWDDKTTGEKRQKVKVQADRVQFLDRKEPAGMSDDDEGSAPAPPRRAGSGGYGSDTRGGGGVGNGSRSAPSPSRRPSLEPEPPMDDEGDDIPF